MGTDRRRLTREDLEAMREELGLGLYHHERAQDLVDDLRQVRRAVRLGMSLQAWASGPGLCHKGRMRLRDYASIVALFSNREIDELQATIDERRRTRALLDEADAAAVALEPPQSQAWEMEIRRSD